MNPFAHLFQPTLTILSMEVDSAAPFAEVRARPKGILAALMSLIGFGRVYTYTADLDGFQEHMASPVTETRTYVPWGHVSACVFITSKPIQLIIAAIVLLPAAVSMLAVETAVGLGFLLLSALLVVFYFLAKKRTQVGIIGDAGTAEVMRVEVKGRQLEELQELFAMLQTLVKDAGGAGLAPSRPAPRGETAYQSRPRAAAAPPPPADESRLFNCPHCNMRMKIPSNASGKRVNCPSCQQPFMVP